MGIEAVTYINDFNSTWPLGSDQRSTADDHHRLIKAGILASFANITGAMTASHIELNLLASYVGSVIPDFDVVGDWNKQQSFGLATLTDAAGVAWDLDNEQVAEVTLGGNRTLNDPTNMQAGASYILIIKQDPTGARTLSYDSAYKWPDGQVPVLSTGANDIDIFCFVSDGTSMFGSTLQDFS